MLWRAALLLCTLVGLLSSSAGAETVIHAVEVSDPPTLDGVLDDKCWADLPECTGFVDSQTRQPAQMQTCARICYDKRSIYVAIHAAHPDPAKIKAVETKRNGNFNADDFVTVSIDSTHMHQTASSFSVSAHGTQAESMETSSATKIEWKGDWHAASKIVDDGYNVEMAIPFSLLIYNKDQKTLGVSFSRHDGTTTISTLWPDLNGNWDHKYDADWSDLTLPQLKPKPVLMGYLLGASDAGSVKTTGQGLDLRYPITNDSTALLSIKPDLSNVQQDVESVDFSYTERLLSDYRPFFQDWGLPVNTRVFYSRRVSDFDIGARYANKQGPDTYGLMNIRTPGEANDTILGYEHLFNERSAFRFNLGDHRVPGLANTVSYTYGRTGWVDGRRHHSVNGGVFNSSTTDKPGGQMRHASYSSWGGDGDIGVWLNYSHIDQEFDGQIGYSPDIGVYGTIVEVYRDKSYRNRNLLGHSIDITSMDWKRIGGAPYARTLTISNNLNYTDGHAISLSLRREDRDTYHDVVPSISLSWNNNQLNKGGSVSYSWGRRVGGSYRYIGTGQTLRIGSRLVTGLSFGQEHIGAPSEYAGTRGLAITTVNYDFSPERSIGGRIVHRLGMDNLYLMYRQQVRRGMDAYIIYGDPNSDTTVSKISLKLVRPLW